MCASNTRVSISGKVSEEIHQNWQVTMPSDIRQAATQI